MKRALLASLFLSAALLVACGSVGSSVSDQKDQIDVTVDVDASPDQGGNTADSTPPDAVDTAGFDLAEGWDSRESFSPGCIPGEGCFLDPCTDNAQCQSGWCVDHMGAGVCT